MKALYYGGLAIFGLSLFFLLLNIYKAQNARGVTANHLARSMFQAWGENIARSSRRYNYFADDLTASDIITYLVSEKIIERADDLEKFGRNRLSAPHGVAIS